MFPFSKRKIDPIKIDPREEEDKRVKKEASEEGIYILTKRPDETDPTTWTYANLRLIQDIKQEIKYLQPPPNIRKFVTKYLEKRGITNYQGNGNIDTLVEEVEKPQLTTGKLIEMRKQLEKPTGVRLDETDPNYLVKYVRENFVTQHTLPVQAVRGSMLMDSIFSSVEKKNKDELAKCIMHKEVFSIDLLHPDIQDLLRTRSVTIQLVQDKEEFQVRDEIWDALDRFHHIGAQADEKAAAYSEESRATTQYEVPLCFLVICGAHRGIHSTIVFLIQGKLYSIGFGYWNETDLQSQQNMKKEKIGLLWASHVALGALYSADRVFSPSLENRIAGVWLLEQDIVEKIKETIQTSKNMWGTLSIVADKNGDALTDDNGNELVIVEECILDTSKTYNTIPTDEEVESNCAAWAQKILGTRIDCSLFGLPAMPSKCRQVLPPNMTNQKMFDIIRSYQESDANKLLELLSVPASVRTGMWSPELGGKRKTKTKKHIKRKTKKHINKTRRYRNRNKPNKKQIKNK